MQVVKCSKRGALVHKNSLASCQRCRHSVELHALTCPFEQNNLNALSLLSGHPTNTYLLRETLLWVGPNQEYSIINNQFSISLARRSTFCKFQYNLEISFMDTNGDLDDDDCLYCCKWWCSTLDGGEGLCAQISYFRFEIMNYVPCGTFTANPVICPRIMD